MLLRAHKISFRYFPYAANIRPSLRPEASSWFTHSPLPISVARFLGSFVHLGIDDCTRHTISLIGTRDIIWRAETFLRVSERYNAGTRVPITGTIDTVDVAINNSADIRMPCNSHHSIMKIVQAYLNVAARSGSRSTLLQSRWFSVVYGEKADYYTGRVLIWCVRR